jgi:hypothetical protein
MGRLQRSRHSKHLEFALVEVPEKVPKIEATRAKFRGHRFRSRGTVPRDFRRRIYISIYIVQFQFYRSLCIAAGEYNPDNKKVPLHKCDFYESTAAGEKLRSTW